jgi:regulatory protein
VQALRSELYRKGIDRTTIDATLSDTDLTGDEYEQALTLARAALRKYADAPNYATFQRRLGGYLQRRGFGFDTISSILDLLWQEVQQGDA